MSHRIRSIACILAAAICSTAMGQQDLATQLKAIKGVVNVTAGNNGSFTLQFEQPIDHKNPALGTFRQRVYVAGSNADQPVLLGTEGYSANGLGGGGELQQILGGNQINRVTVEHRFFGQSMPRINNEVPWTYLTVKNAADDMHEVVSALKTIYKGKWVATGSSKGGQTALFYKCYYPEDVAATVAYVAPVNIGQEDPRINIFINTVGDAETRKKIKDYQIAMFKREEEILPLLNATPQQFPMGVAKAYEYGVLEYPYAFWQYGTKPNTIPAPDAPAAAMVAHFRQVNTMRWYGEPTVHQFEAFIYEAFSEIGYYNYDVTDFRPYMHAFSFKNGDTPTNLDIAPAGTKDKIVYNPAAMAYVFNYLQYKANNVIYVYGETDAWSATQMQLLGRTNAVKIVVENASHSARIGAASAEQKKQVFDALDEWMGMKVNRL